MGEVYKARDTRLDRTVAIKVLPAQFAAHAELRQRLEREARAVSSLNHPHICTLYDVGRQDDTDFLILEYLEGETLAGSLKKGPLPKDTTLRYAVEIAFRPRCGASARRGPPRLEAWQYHAHQVRKQAARLRLDAHPRNEKTGR